MAATEETTSTGGTAATEETASTGSTAATGEATSTGGTSSSGEMTSSESTSSETSSGDNVAGADKNKGSGGATTAPVVQLISLPKQDLNGLIKVMVTEKTYSFSLPENLQSQIENTGGSVKISMANGASLPGWLQYNTETKTFAAKNAPNNGKPVNVVVTIDNVKWIISINNLVTQ